jgi:ABC-2 type transport system ATP-binding protein
LKVNATVTDVLKQVREHTVLVVEPSTPDQLARIATLLEGHDKVQSLETGDASIRVVLRREVSDYSDLPRRLIENGVNLRRFSEEELDLESAFMALTKGTSVRM